MYRPKKINHDHGEAQGKMVSTCIATACKFKALPVLIHSMVNAYKESIPCYVSRGRGAGRIAFQALSVSTLRAVKVESNGSGRVGCASDPSSTFVALNTDCTLLLTMPLFSRQ